MKFQILTSAGALAIVGAGTAAAPEADEAAPRRRLAKTRDAPRGFEDQAAEVNPYNFVAKESTGKGGTDKKKKEGADKKKKEEPGPDKKKKGEDKKKKEGPPNEDDKDDKNKSSSKSKNSSKSKSSSSSSGGSGRSGGSSSSSSGSSEDYRARGADLSRGVCVHKKKAEKKGVEDACASCEPMPPPAGPGSEDHGFCKWLFDDGTPPPADDWAVDPALYIYEAYDRADFREQAAEILEMLQEEAAKGEGGGKGGNKGEKKKKEGKKKEEKKKEEKEGKKKEEKKKGEEKKKEDDKKKKEDDDKDDKNKSSKSKNSSKSKSSSSSSSSRSGRSGGSSSSSSGSSEDYRARGADLSRGVCLDKKKAEKKGVEDECDKCDPTPPPADPEYGFCEWLFDDGKVPPAAEEWSTNPGLYIYEANDRDDFHEQAAEILEMLEDEAAKGKGGNKGGNKKEKKEGKKKEGKKKEEKKEGKKKEEKKKEKKEEKKKEDNDKDKDSKSDKDNKNKSSSSSKSDKKKKKNSSSSSGSSSSSSSRSFGGDRSGDWKTFQGYGGYEGMCEEDKLKKKEKDDCQKMWDDLCKTTTLAIAINFCDYVGLSGPPEEASLDIFWDEGRNLRG